MGMISSIFLILANCVPLLGIVLWHWLPLDIFFFYWLESGVVFIYGSLKLSIEQRWEALLSVPFLAIHFGLFMMLHLFILLSLFGPLPMADVMAQTRNLIVILELQEINVQNNTMAALALFLSHGVSFYFRYLKNKEYKLKKYLAISPYIRIFLMHCVILVGGLIYMWVGRVTSVLFVFVIFKIIVDLRMHHQEHHLN